MRTNLWRLTSILVLLAMLLSPAGAASSASAAPIKAQPAAAQKSNVQVIDASYVGVSKSLSSLAPGKVQASAAAIARSQQPLRGMPKSQNALSAGGFDPSIVQDGPVSNSMPAPIANFEGVNNVSGVYPPDTQGDVGNDPATGKKYYIQWVNLAFKIWDVTAPAAPISLYGPAAGNTLWAGTGTACASSNDGDPITQFDHLANRWMMSQFALPSYPSGPFYECIAISQTADPTGAWYLYTFKTSDTLMDDYPHFGVWPDGYYMTVNQFGVDAGAGCDVVTEWCGAGVGVFERTAMLAGLPARLLYINTGAATLDYGGMLPSDLDGPAPAAGTPNYFMEWDNAGMIGTPVDTVDTLRIWEFKTDWAVPANTTFGADASYTPNLKIATANVDPNMCGGSRNCIPQPGTTQKLDAIADRLMYRLQYRNFGTYQTIVGNHTVDSTGTDIAGIHWFELRNSGAGWDLGPYPTAGTYQEGVYVGDAANTENRWMGSAAMDGSGNIALGYSVSNGTTYPSIRYTGRLAADPAGTLPQGETSLMVGSGSQTGTASRWGDYSMMAVDDADNCTFWYTQEYYATTSSVGWQTRVGSFKFPGCTTAPTGVLSGTVTDSGAAPLANATVEATGGYSTVTDAAGHYAFNLVAGTYSVTASKYGYVSSTVPGVVVTPPGTTTQNFTLATGSTSTISGVVTDSTTGWPLYARLEIFGFPGSPIFTNPVTGAYSVNLVDGSYTFTVSAMSGGYTPAVLPLIVSGSATQNFGLAADLVACSAPGYAVAPPAFSENFETWPNTAGWTVVNNAAGSLVWDSNLLFAGYPNWTGGAGQAAMANGDPSAFNGVLYDTELVSPVITLSSLANLGLVYKANFITWGETALDLDVKNVGDPAWSNVSSWTSNHGTMYGLPGETVAVDLTPYVTANFQLRWHYYLNAADPAPWDYYAQIDEVSIGAGCSPIASGGLVIGSVFDANTSLLVMNASVKDAALKSALLIDASADPATPAQMYVIAEPAGSVTLTASSATYGTDTKSPTVVAGGTVGQDFHLPAGQLSASPTSLSFTVATTAPTDSKPLALNNTGGVAANYEVFAIPGTFGGYAPVGPFADHTRHFGPKNLNDKDASQIRVDFMPLNVPIISGAGDLVSSWSTGLFYGWGIGFNTDANDLWIGSIGAGGGDNLDHRFTTAGATTADTIDMSPWVGSFGGDMTYNPFTNKLWQVNVGGDNCIYELDPATKVDTGNKICPAFGTSERGLAFDPATNTYYAGSWNDGIINHFAPNGTIIDSMAVGLNIAGLAYNPSTGHLFVSVSAATVTNPALRDIYVLDAKNSYALLGSFNIMNGATRVITVDSSEKGLEIDCSGNLWLQVHTASSDQAVSFASGETGVCNWQASWLSATPNTGLVAASGTTPLTVNVNATGMPVGTYPAYLRVVNNTPYGDEIVPVSLTTFADVTAPTVNTFTVTTPSNSHNIPITAFTASDDVAVTGYLITTSATPPAAGDAGWTGTAPTTFTVASDGSYTLYPWAKDAAGNVSAVFASPRAVVVDTVGPIVTSITRVNPNPTNLASVDFTVTFSKPVTGVDMVGPTFADFALTTSAGITGASVTGVSGSGTIYTVTVNTGSGNGTLRLDVVTGGSIVDAALNPLTAGFTTGQIYSVIKTATFADVPLSYWANSWIERLYINGVTGGCGIAPLIYCPEANITRAEMAVFILRGEHGPAYTPPPATGTVFTDVAIGDFAAAWIEQMHAESITGGCTPTTFCPGANVTRAEVAVFLLRAKHGPAYTPPAATGTVFTDVSASSFAAAWIEQMHAEGISGGCTPTTFCPGNPVSRAQMAIFIVTTFSLP